LRSVRPEINLRAAWQRPTHAFGGCSPTGGFALLPFNQAETQPNLRECRRADTMRPVFR